MLDDYDFVAKICEKARISMPTIDDNAIVNMFIILSEFTDREQYIIKQRVRYGNTQKIVGKALGISAQSIGYAERKIYRKLRHPSRVKILTGKANTADAVTSSGI